MTNKTLISACLQKDPKAEKQLFLRFAPKVLTICRRYASNDQDAEDYLQECFIHLFDHLYKYDEQKGEFAGCLYRVCTNRILQSIRASKKIVDLVYPSHLPEVELKEEEIGNWPQETILKAIQQLPEAYRIVINLYSFEGWNHHEIAEELQITASSSRSRLTRARVMLKNILKKTDRTDYEKGWFRKKIV